MKSRTLHSSFSPPLVTLAVVLAAAIPYLFPALSPYLLYERSAILHGQIWRLATGNFVHYSRSHFLYDAVAFGVAGFLIESRNYRKFGLLCVLSSFAVGISLLVFSPHLETYAGLSGVATGAVVFLALNELGRSGPGRWFYGLIFAALSAKIAFELVTGKTIFVDAQAASFTPIPLSHLVGALTALLLYHQEKVAFRCASPRC